METPYGIEYIKQFVQNIKRYQAGAEYEQDQTFVWVRQRKMQFS